MSSAIRQSCAQSANRAIDPLPTCLARPLWYVRVGGLGLAGLRAPARVHALRPISFLTVPPTPPTLTCLGT
jgi:hypothetical protein